jgi:hypothetical protein
MLIEFNLDCWNWMAAIAAPSPHTPAFPQQEIGALDFGT